MCTIYTSLSLFFYVSQHTYIPADTDTLTVHLGPILLIEF